MVLWCSFGYFIYFEVQFQSSFEAVSLWRVKCKDKFFELKHVDCRYSNNIEWLQFTVYPTVVCSRALCTYCGIFSPKKNGFSEKKIFPEKNKFLLPFFNVTFQCGRYNVFKNFFFNFLPMKSWKNHPKKLLRISPDPFFPQSSPGHSPQPKIDFPY